LPESNYTIAAYFKDKTRVQTIGTVARGPWRMTCPNCGGDVVIADKDTPVSCLCEMHEFVVLSTRPHKQTKTKPPAVDAYYRIASAYIRYGKLEVEWEREIDERVGSKPVDIERWRTIVKAYIERDWDVRKVDKILDYFVEGRMPGSKKRKVAGQKGVREETRIINGKEVKVTIIDPQPVGVNR